MALSDERMKACMRRLLISRMRLLCTHGFYGLLLMHMHYAIDENESTARTDGKFIVFGAEFLEGLSEDELDFVLMHEILHVVLQHCFRGRESDQELFNIACDIVVNSCIMKELGLIGKGFVIGNYGEPMHKTPNGKEGWEYTAEQVYSMLLEERSLSAEYSDGTEGESWDDHSGWGDAETSEADKNAWIKRLKDAVDAIELIESMGGIGNVPTFAKRMLGLLGSPKLDWRTVLNDFVQEETVDYSLSPPDRRFDGGDFFLPDFNEKDDKVENILFMVDTSGSMSDKMVTDAYSEISGAIEQFGGRLKGWLGFFDDYVVEPVPFSDEADFKVIRPAGGGGTDFSLIFRYVREEMDEMPVSIVVLTDGEAVFPPEEDACGIPTLWLINNEYVDPPWGRVARI